MPIITLYQGASGSGQELAQALGDALGYRRVGRSELVAQAQRYGISEAKLVRVLEEGPSLWQRWMDNMQRYRVALQAGFCDLAAEENLVYHGHVGHELLPGIGHVLKVLLTAPIEVRIEQVRSRIDFSEAQARRYIEETDKARSHRLMSMFSVDWRDAARFDLVLNLDHVDIISAGQIIMDMAKLAAFQPTLESRQRFKDLSLTARAHGALFANEQLRGSLLHVTAAKGHVHVSGSLALWLSDDEVVKTLEQVAGATKVTTDLNPIPLEMVQ